MVSNIAPRVSALGAYKRKSQRTFRIRLTRSHSLTWYQDYNTVKHRRKTNFHLANLKIL
jgi:hypothetical protein